MIKSKMGWKWTEKKADGDHEMESLAVMIARR
jgi:hypothetical protein